VKETVEALKANGIDALGYHGKMEAPTRRRNQETWMAGDVRVIVGTVAFGLGINKADVRAVIHLSLPKSIEQYYQEAGRGGRDGRPTDCLLLWQPRDAGLLGHFISQIHDAAEKERAWQRYNTIRDFVESNACRHRRICSHFGEKTKWETCGACDVCGYIPDWLISPLPPKPRKRSKGQRPEKILPIPAPSPASIPAYSHAPISASMRASTAAAAPPKVALPAPVAADLAELRAYLREWRRQTAQRQSIAAFVVMHDTTLDDLCEKRPTSLAELRNVFGFGVRKIELYGAEIIAALRKFSGGARADASQRTLSASAR